MSSTSGEQMPTGGGEAGDQASTASPSSTLTGSTTNSGERQGNKNKGKRNGKGKSGSGTRNIVSTFKGNTPEMNGHVFQCHAETTDKQQYQNTIAALSEYINKELKYAKDVAAICQKGEITKIQEPVDLDPKDKESETKKMIHKAKVDSYVKRCEIQEANLQAIFSVVWGQCSANMQAKIQSLPDYEEKSEAWDCPWLLKEVKGITHMFEGTRSRYLSIDDARANYINCRQGPQESVHDFMKRFRTLAEVLEHYGAKIGNDPILYENETFEDAEKPDDSDKEETAKYVKRQIRAARDKSIAMAFLKRADRKRFGLLWSDLQNLYSRGHNQYPEDLTSAYNMLVNFRSAPTNKGRGKDSDNNSGTTGDNVSGMSFLQQQQNGFTPGTDGVVYEDVECFRCGQPGHYRGQCPAQTGSQFFQHQSRESRHPPTLADVPEQQEQPKDQKDHEAPNGWTGFSFAQSNEHSGAIPHSWVLLDSQSTVSVFNNKQLLTNVRRSDVPLKVHSNGGTQVSTFVGDIPNFGVVWYNPRSLANILSMAAVRKVCRITMDSAVEAALCVHKRDGSVMKFREFHSGLYYYDTNDAPVTKPTAPQVDKPTTSTTVAPYPSPSQYIFINTVETNKRLFTKREVERADEARALFRKIDRPSYPMFEHYLRNNFIRNCPLTVDDNRRALLIYGPDPAALKGKTVNKGMVPVTDFRPIHPPAPILHYHQDVVLAVDILYINGIMFITTISRKIKFRTIAPINNRSKATILREVLAVKGLYEARGFSVVDIHGDQEFACITEELRPTRLNIANADDHVPEVERSIRTIKERVRATIHSLPFQRLPKLMVRATAEKAVRSLNHFPAQDGVSKTLSPLTIMTGRPNMDYNGMALEFGSYAQVFEANDPTNTTKARTTGAIVLNPTDNDQGGFYFMSLSTGKRLSRRQWEELPMPNEVIARVETMAEGEGQRLMGNGLPLFEWTPGVEIDDEEEGPVPLIDPEPYMEDDEDQFVMDDEDVIDDDSVLLEGNRRGGNEDNDDDEVESLPSDEELYGTAVEENNEAESVGQDEAPEGDELNGADEGAPPIEPEPIPEPQDYDPHDTDDSAGGATGDEERQQEGRYNLRTRRERNYDHRLDHQMDEPESEQSYRHVQMLQHALEKPAGPERNLAVSRVVTAIILTQMTANAGIKKHGQPAVDALFKEFAQLDGKTVFQAMEATSLTAKQKKEALRAINLIKEKRNGILKGRTCADGSTQRKDYTKEETASPTVSSDALMMSCLIDSIEQRDVGVADVTGAYLNADMDEFTLLRLTGEAVTIMCKVNPEYKKYVVVEKGRNVLYLKLLKALYGCVRSALLWYELFSTTLEELGFKINPYDPCVANKMVNGSQCTVVWYVDDNKISHKDPAVVSHVIEKIEEKFGKMTVTRGRKHTFLGMDIEFRKDATVSVKMASYLKEAITEFGDKIRPSSTSPARNDLFDVDEKSPVLGEERAKIFHQVVAKLLYVAKRARLDIQLPVAFLCTRVSKCTEEDWAKLRRVLEFVNGTIEDELILGADDLAMMMTWVDASFAVHADMKSHTGGSISFGRGALMAKSSKQKLNTKSSTEAELVGASDYLPSTLWLKKFLSEQGYELKSNKFFQDNQSAMRLELNGRRSAGQKSRHIDIRYFFIKDRVAEEDIKIEYCATESMLADFFTKPLQGALFKRLRAVVMGHEHTDVLASYHTAASQERVGSLSDSKTGEQPNELAANERQTRNGSGATSTEEKKRTYADAARQAPSDRIVSE